MVAPNEEAECTTATCVWLVWRYDLCSGSDHEICGRSGGGASAIARDGRAGEDRFVEPKDRERARDRFDATEE